MSDRYIVQWTDGDGLLPNRPFNSQREALDFVKELFEANGMDGVEVNIFLNDTPYIGYRRLCQWHKGMVTLD